MLDNWKNFVGGCFGSEDGKFAIHCADRERAIDLLKKCDLANVLLDDLLSECETYLRTKYNANVKDQKKFDEHIDEQIARIRKMFDGWLS